MTHPPPAHPQAGITNRPPDHALFAALTLATPDPPSTREAVEALRTTVARELRSDLDETSAESPKDQPSAETGELGFLDGYDRYHLTITVGFGLGAYEKLGIPQEQRPQDLIDIPWAQLSDTPDRPDNGDLLLQICTDSVYLAEHVLRRVEQELDGRITVSWTVGGAQRHNSRAGRVNRGEGRALIGFLDGTSNLNPRTSVDDARLVFVDPDHIDYPPQTPPLISDQPSPYGGPQLPQFPPDLRVPPVSEPSWTKNGSYLVVRASWFDSAAWDRRALADQERTIGRFKVSGASLDLQDSDEFTAAPPAFAADPSNETVAVNAHIRKANARGPGDDQRRVFRRGYPLIQATLDGQRRGLVFAAFGRTISTQFEFMTRAWTANENFPRPGAGHDPLRDIEHVLCGGYFFVPPVTHRSKPWTWTVPDVSPAT